MSLRQLLGCCVAVLLSAVTVAAATSKLADAAMKRNKEAALNGSRAMVEKLIKAGADPNTPLTQSGEDSLRARRARWFIPIPAR